MIFKTGSQLNRQELTRHACDALAASGKKPSIDLVRERTIAITDAKKGPTATSRKTSTAGLTTY